MSKEEINKFKEELLQVVYQLEKKIIEDVNYKKAQLNANYEKNNEKINQIISHNREIIESVVSEKINCEKIQNLEKFKNKADGILITHEIRINKSNKDIDDMKAKYDKIIVDNLSVPGYVGPACQYKNIGEYIVYNISEFSKIKYEKDNLKKETKEIKSKVEGMFKKIITLVDNSVEKFKEYTDKQIEQFRKHFNMKYEEFDQKSILIRKEIAQTKLDIEKQVNTLKSENEQILNITDNLKKQEENIEKINNKITKINERIKNIEKILKIDNTKKYVSDGKSKNRKRTIKEKEPESIKEFDFQTHLEKNKRKRNSLLIENRGKNSLLNTAPKKASPHKNKKDERRSSIKDKDLKSLTIFENENGIENKIESSKNCTLKQIKIISLEPIEIKEERKNDSDKKDKINNNFNNIKINKENEINIMNLKNIDIINDEIKNKLLSEQRKDDFKIIKNEISIDIKEENEKINKILEKQEDSKSFTSEKSSDSKNSENQKSESINNKDFKIGKDIVKNYILNENKNKSKSNRLLNNFSYNKENDTQNKQNNLKLSNNKGIELNSFTIKQTINKSINEKKNIFPIISLSKKSNVTKSKYNSKKDFSNNISRNSNSINNSINNINSNITSKRNSHNNSSNKTINMKTFNHKNDDKIFNIIQKFNSKMFNKKNDLIQCNNVQNEQKNLNQNTASPTLLNLGVNYVGLNIDNSDEDNSDDERRALSGKKLNKLRLEGFGVSSPNSQKVANKKIKLQGISTEAPLKISAAFGRTAYTFFDKNNEQNKIYSIKINKRKNMNNENLGLVLAPNHK